MSKITTFFQPAKANEISEKIQKWIQSHGIKSGNNNYLSWAVKAISRGSFDNACDYIESAKKCYNELHKQESSSLDKLKIAVVDVYFEVKKKNWLAAKAKIESIDNIRTKLAASGQQDQKLEIIVNDLNKELEKDMQQEVQNVAPAHYLQLSNPQL